VSGETRGKDAIFDRLEKFNVLFSGELRAFLIAVQPIRNWRVEAGVAARGAEARAAWTMYPLVVMK
jgi:hypothetical protein